MNTVDPYLLGDGMLYARLCALTEVLGVFVACAPRAATLAELEKQTGRTPKELLKLCGLLRREGLLAPSGAQRRSWLLAREASGVTLEDAFRCAVAAQSARRTVRQTPPSQGETVQREVNLLVMQATMGINQSVFQHLRQFSLDRLKLGAGMLSSRSASGAGWPGARLSFS